MHMRTFLAATVTGMYVNFQHVFSGYVIVNGLVVVPRKSDSCILKGLGLEFFLEIG